MIEKRVIRAARGMKETFEEYLKEIQRIAAEEGFEDLDATYVEHLRCRFLKEPVVIGRTQRIRLRELRLSDLETLYEFSDAFREPVLKPFIRESKEASRENLQAYISNQYPFYDYGIYAAELLKKGEIIGLCGLGQAQIAGEACVDLGYYISPQYRQQGLAKECVEIVLDYAKNYLEFPVIYAIIKEENRISEKILRRFEFAFVNGREAAEKRERIFRKVFPKEQKAHEGESQ